MSAAKTPTFYELPEIIKNLKLYIKVYVSLEGSLDLLINKKELLLIFFIIFFR